MSSFPAPTGPNPAGANVLHGWPITQNYGNNGHPGIDLGLPTGTPLLATEAGIVRQFADGTAASAGGGNWTNLEADDGFTYGYGHASRYAVPNGTRVVAGQIIAYSGSTGYSTGPHLHFARRRTGPGIPWSDPTPYLRSVDQPAPAPAPTPPAPTPAPHPEEITMDTIITIETKAGAYLYDPHAGTARVLNPDEVALLAAPVADGGAGYRQHTYPAGGAVHRILNGDGLDSTFRRINYTTVG